MNAQSPEDPVDWREVGAGPNPELSRDFSSASRLRNLLKRRFVVSEMDFGVGTLGTAGADWLLCGHGTDPLVVSVVADVVPFKSSC